MQPLISVVMTTHDSQRYVSSAIRSVLAQTFTAWELIVVDDGSTDDTRNILAEFAKRDQRIRVIEHTHIGLARAANLGCEQVRSRYVARLDSDDIALPLRLSTQWDCFENQPDLVLLGASTELISPTGIPFGTWREPDTKSGLELFLKSHNCFCHSSVMLRVESFRRVGG